MLIQFEGSGQNKNVKKHWNSSKAASGLGRMTPGHMSFGPGPSQKEVRDPWKKFRNGGNQPGIGGFRSGGRDSDMRPHGGRVNYPSEGVNSEREGYACYEDSQRQQYYVQHEPCVAGRQWEWGRGKPWA